MDSAIISPTERVRQNTACIAATSKVVSENYIVRVQGRSYLMVAGAQAVATSMGFTPIEGLLMGTRCGDIDPSLVLHMMASGGETPSEMEALLTRKSGLYGISGLSADMRKLLEHRAKGDSRAALAIDVFCYRVRKYIGSYLTALGGADAIVFTGGIGENAAPVRAEVCANLERLGIHFDGPANENTVGREGMISHRDSPVEVWVIPTNEELLIARDTLRCLHGMPQPD